MNHLLQKQSQVPSQSSEVTEEGTLLSKFQKDVAYSNAQKDLPVYTPCRIPIVQKELQNNAIWKSMHIASEEHRLSNHNDKETICI